MATITRSSGISVSTSGPVAVVRPAAKRRAARGAPVADDTSDLTAALAAQDLELVDEIPLAIEDAARPRKRGAPGRRGSVQIDVPLADDESAVVLLEDEGEFRWLVDGKEIGAPRGGGRGRRSARSAATGPRQVRFKVELTPVEPSQDKPATRRKRGGVASAIWGKARAYVFKFAVRLAGKHIVRFLERSVKQGLVAITSTASDAWKRLGGDDALPQPLPAGRKPRVLLLVHGTFSSTLGSFGALAATAWGRELLRQALSAYDAVLGFDHRTLSVDPQVNAVDMLQRLESIAWPEPPVLDIVAFSRGGLVARSLIEQLLPASRWKAEIGRVIFVGSTNGGTKLAEPDNWHRLADRYTNFAIWGTRALGLVPGAQGVAGIVGEAIQGVATLVKVLATHAVEEQGVPGLAAMEPDGAFVTAINETQPGQPSAADALYCAVVSDFEPGKALADGTTPELPPKLLLRLADRVADDLFGEANDMVVNTGSMTAIDPHVGGFVKDKLDFGTNGLVYHTVYFARRETVEALARWLGLDTAVAAGGNRRKPGAVVRGSASPVARSNILVVPAEAPTGQVLEATKHAEPDFVVVEREYRGEDLFYAYSPTELRNLTRGSSARTALRESLDLHEQDASRTGADVPGAATMMYPGDPTRPAAWRTVVLGGGGPVSVVPSATDLPALDEQQGAEEIHEAAVGAADAAADVAARRMTSAPSVVRRRAPTKKKAAKRSATKKKGARAAPAPAAPAGDEVECHVRAEMDEEVVADQVTDVEVTIAREMLGEPAHGASATGRARVRRDRELIVHIADRRNFRVESDRRVTIKVPEPGQPQMVYFSVVGLLPDTEGELWVTVRQGSIPLVTLKLFPRIVAQRVGGSRRSRASVNLGELPAEEKPLDELIIDEKFIGDQVFYRYYLSLPSLNVREQFDSQPLPGARDAYITQILNEIGDSWAGAGAGGLAAFERGLKAIGGKMFDQLIPSAMQQVLWDNRDRIRSVQVFSMEPFIPWELVYLKQPGRRRIADDSLFLGELGLVRWLYAGWPKRALHLRKGKARYVAPDYPPSLELDEMAAEVAMLETLLGAKPVDPVLNDVQTLLATPGAFDILHFAGHGEAAGTELSHARLLIDGDLDAEGAFVGDALSATTVEQTADLAYNGGPLVVLNACESARRNREFAGMGGFADAFVRAGAGAFVGTHWSVGDGPARAFVAAFYKAFVASGGRKRVTLSDAVTRARRAARQEGDATWLAYVVYGHPYAVMTKDD